MTFVVTRLELIRRGVANPTELGWRALHGSSVGPPGSWASAGCILLILQWFSPMAISGLPGVWVEERGLNASSRTPLLRCALGAVMQYQQLLRCKPELSVGPSRRRRRTPLRGHRRGSRRRCPLVLVIDMRGHIGQQSNDITKAWRSRCPSLLKKQLASRGRARCTSQASAPAVIRLEPGGAAALQQIATSVSTAITGPCNSRVGDPRKGVRGTAPH